MTDISQGDREKQSAAWNSLLTAIGLAGMKTVVGLMTGSLGILAEAAHSGLDLVAAITTFLAVRISGKPPDTDHLYGHGKVENLSALFETALLLVTCIWIVREAIGRLLHHHGEMEVTVWSFAVMLVFYTLRSKVSATY
jgi:cation diffusion facilitator family transporter